MTFGSNIRRNKLDEVFSKLVRAQAGYICQACGDGLGAVKQLECAHIMSRRYRRTRHFLPNARCLCTGCHKFYTDNPLDWVEFIGPELYGDLRALAQKTFKITDADKEDIYRHLCRQLAELTGQPAPKFRAHRKPRKSKRPSRTRSRAIRGRPLRQKHPEADLLEKPSFMRLQAPVPRGRA